MKIRRVWAVAANVTFGALALLHAQEPADVLFHKEVKVVSGGAPADNVMFYHEGPGPFTVDFVGAEMSFDDKTVKGAPYTADAVTETTQVLSDGNRITRKSTATIYRDNEGRTRREETMGAIGPWSSAGEPVQHIFIHDPVANLSYMLDPQTHTAQKLMIGREVFTSKPAANAKQGGVTIRRRGGFAEAPSGVKAGLTVAGTFEGPGAKFLNPDAKTQSLGKQTMEGVEAEGTRSTVTVAAGTIGNERPIESVSERWYSPELQTVVMSKRSDPRFGETVYRLINVRRGEQPATLFEVPADYTVREDPGMEPMIRARKKAEEAK
jgi:hypothetical protein